MAGISDKAIKTSYPENKFRYNDGTELQNKEFSDGTGLELYDAGFRMLDPQLGRFSQVDPLADRDHSYSAYQYAGDNPISNNDPSGLLQQNPQTLAEENELMDRAEQGGGGGYTDPGMEESQEEMDFNFSIADDYVGGTNGGSTYGQGPFGGGGGGYSNYWNALWASVPDNGSASYTSDPGSVGTFYNYQNASGSASYETSGYHGIFSYQEGQTYAFTGTTTHYQLPAVQESEGYMNTINEGDEFLDKGFFANDMISNVFRLPESEIVEHTGTIVSLIGASHSISQGVESMEKGNISNAIYKTVIGGGTVGIVFAIGVGVLAPEALLLWAGATLVSDLILKATSDTDE